MLHLSMGLQNLKMCSSTLKLSAGGGQRIEFVRLGFLSGGEKSSKWLEIILAQFALKWSYGTVMMLVNALKQKPL